MFIISKWHDYYDKAIGFGIDKTCIYKRETQDFRKKHHRYPRHTFTPKDGRYELYDGVLGFCGKLFPLVIVRGTKQTTLWGPSVNDDRFLYSRADLEKFLQEMGIFPENAKNRNWRWRYLGFGSSTKLLLPAGQEEFFNTQNHASLDKLFVDKKCPVFFHDSDGLILNPKLSDYQFQKIKDSFTAFQDIFMYISGVLGTNENPMVTLSDVDKRDKKGFDKWSFKTRPHKDKK